MTFHADDWPRVKAIFDMALTRPAAGDRLAYVASACGHDTDLKRQVDALLASHESADAFLERQAVALADLVEQAPPADDLTGRHVGAYEIASRIGAGGMGEVYLARDTKLNRQVAIKVLAPHLAADPEQLSRFQQEARAVSSLNHPHILVIHDVGQLEGRAFIVTEYVEGQTLRARLRDGPLNTREAIEITEQIASALGAAHDRGIVHRDVKPENVMLRPDGYVKVLDFGLAKLATRDDTGAESMLLTRPGMVMGTPWYMSPEQIRGEQADATSDIFSLGCVIYEMLTARRAFERPSPADTLAAILKEEPRTIDGVPPDLGRLVRRCLEKNPHERFQSARDLASDLRSLATSREADDAPADSLAVLPFTNAGGADAEYLSDGIAESLINSFSKITRLRVIPRGVVFRYKGREIDPRAVGRELGVRMLLSGKVVERGGHLSVQAELVDVAANKQLWGERWHRPLADIFEVEEAISRQIADKLRMRLSGEEKEQLARRYTENSEAYQLYLNARYHFLKRTPEGLKKGIQYCEQAIEKDSEFALAYAALADCYIVLSAMSVLPARQVLAKAKDAATRAVEADGTLAEAHNSLAYARVTCDRDWAEAEKGFRHALELNPASWITHDWYGQVLHCEGRLDEGLAHMRRAQELEPLSVVLHHHAAWILWLARRDDDALEECRKAHELDPSFPLPYMWSGLAYEQKSMHEESIGALRKGCELWGGNPICVGSLAHACAAAGRRDETQQLLRQLEERSQQRYVEPYAMALIHAALGEVDHVFEWLERAYEDRSIWLTTLVKCDPRLDPLRSDPRFRDLLRRMRLDR